MYNLMVTACAGDWERNFYEFGLSRVIREYTDDTIIEKYQSLTETAISDLISFPTLFAYEQNEDADAHVGFLQRIRKRGDQVRLDYKFDSNIPAIPASDLANLSWDLEIDIARGEMHRTHWAVKAVDLLPVLVNSGLVRKEQLSHLFKNLTGPSFAEMPGPLVVAPTVFNIPDHQRETDLVSVMMPFEAAFTPVYDTIRSACLDAGLRCLRADNIWEDSTVIQDIFNLLYRSHTVVVDFSNRNPNVMYETGIAHTLGRPVIPIAQSLDHVPFDLRHHRVLKYLPNVEGLTSMRTTLAERLKSLRARESA